MAVIQKTTYKDQEIEHICELVLDGHYSPGEQIKESLLAREMGKFCETVHELYVRPYYLFNCSYRNPQFIHFRLPLKVGREIIFDDFLTGIK